MFDVSERGPIRAALPLCSDHRTVTVTIPMAVCNTTVTNQSETLSQSLLCLTWATRRRGVEGTSSILLPFVWQDIGRSLDYVP
jgi:hypothetical protein